QSRDRRGGARGVPRPRADGRDRPRPRAGARARTRSRPRCRSDPRRPQRPRRQRPRGGARPVTMHEFEPTDFHITIGSDEPVLRVESGDTIRTWTVDSSGYDHNGEDLTEGGNPQTGPFYVEGAEPGDTLRVHFHSVRPNRARGVSGSVVAPHVVDAYFVP